MSQKIEIKLKKNNIHIKFPFKMTLDKYNELDIKP